MKGLLSEHPLVELIREIKYNSMGGALRVSNQRHKCVAYFAGGDLLFTTSNLKSDRLRECILRWNLVTASQLSGIDENLSDADLSTKLLQGELCDVKTLESALERQIEDILRPCLLWTDGEWSYDSLVRVANTSVQGFDASTLLFEAARRLSPEFASSRLDSPNETLTRTEANWESLALTSLEGFLLSRLDEPRKLHELSAISGIPELETKYTIYCLLMGGLANRSQWPKLFSPEMIAESKKASPNNVRVVTLAIPAISIKSAASASEKASQNDDAAAQRKELEALFARLEFAKTHYEVLGVGSAVDVAQIKSTYYSLARKFHPDRFRHMADEALHSKVESAFARIAQAYEILRVQNLRSAYDHKLDAAPAHTNPVNTSFPDPPTANEVRKTVVDDSKSVPLKTIPQPPAPGKVNETFNRGLSELKEGFPVSAAAAFSECIKLAPREALYRAYYGHALAASKQTRRQAEAEILSAIAMDRQNPLFHILLAELYKRLNLFKRAETAVEQALRLDPGNERARALLADLGGFASRQSSR